MTDYELLELAAKAAGLYIKYPVTNPDDDIIGLKVKPHRQAGRHTSVLWNPLADDGDALWLAVKLNIEIRFHLAGDFPGVSATCVANSMLPIKRETWIYEDDKRSATRRIIVRAAAEIGRSMT